MLAGHVDDIPARRWEGQRIRHVQVGVRWEYGKPVPINDIEETTR